jgi:hypothetical protein
VRNAGFLWVVIGLAYGVPAIMSGKGGMPPWFLLGVLCLVYYRFRQVKFTCIDAADGERILVIKNKEHDAILDAILSNRREALKKRFGDVDPANDPENEAGKFEILRKEEIISDAEYEVAMRKIEDIKNRPIPFMME